MISSLLLLLSLQAPCDLIRGAELHRAGREALARREYDTAIGRFEQALAACPGIRGALADLSDAYARARRFDDAIRTGRQAVESDPHYLPGRLALANAYFMARQFAAAIGEADAVLKIEPYDPAAMKLKGNAEYLMGNVEKAASIFLEAMERHPNDEDAPYMLGRVYYQDGRIDQAMGLFQRVLRVNPRSYKAHDNLGLCYQAKGDTETATRHFLTAIRLVEKDYTEYDSAYANLASLLIDTGDAQQAFAAASKAADRNPYSARNFFIGAKALAKLGKLDLAINWLQRSVALDPEYPEPLYLLAQLYGRTGREQKARETIERFREAKAKESGRRK